MMQLSLLNVSNNKLKTLPESIGSCFSLEELQANGMLISLFFFLIFFPVDIYAQKITVIEYNVKHSINLFFFCYLFFIHG